LNKRDRADLEFSILGYHLIFVFLISSVVFKNEFCQMHDFFLAVLGFELKALSILGRFSIACAMPLALFVLIIY
jgi:hypothetical protein